jgi:predicted enzyme related to lactoylglutathione lyase
MISGVDFVALPTRDYDRAAEFYGEILGLPFRKRWGDMPAGEFQAGDLTLALMQMEAFGQEFRPHGSPVAFHVDDFDAAKAELESKGVAFHMDTIDSGVCKMVFFSDPDGNTVGIHHRYAPGG